MRTRFAGQPLIEVRAFSGQEKAGYGAAIYASDMRGPDTLVRRFKRIVRAGGTKVETTIVVVRSR